MWLVDWFVAWRIITEIDATRWGSTGSGRRRRPGRHDRVERVLDGRNEWRRSDISRPRNRIESVVGRRQLRSVCCHHLNDDVHFSIVKAVIDSRTDHESLTSHPIQRLFQVDGARTRIYPEETCSIHKAKLRQQRRGSQEKVEHISIRVESTNLAHAGANCSVLIYAPGSIRLDCWRRICSTFE